MVMRLDDARAGYIRGEYSAAAETFAGKDKSADDMDNIELLISADAKFQDSDFGASDKYYEIMNKKIDAERENSTAREIVSAVSNQMANNYKPYMMDALFMSYYQLWGALADGRFGDARVIVNQSYARQQDASREYAKLISSRQESDAAKVSERLGESQWRVFSDIMNPALTYLAGIYFLTRGEWADARTYLSRTAGMIPDNEYVASDGKMADGKNIPTDTAWIFIESGFAPKLAEGRIDWPIFAGNKMKIMSIAIAEPQMLKRMPAISGARLVGDVDAMFLTEFREYQINNILRAAASAATKMTMTNIAANQFGTFGNFAGNIYSIATTAAEVRSWATLPKEIHVLRVKKNSDLIKLSSGGKVISEIQVPRSGNHLIYIRYLGGNISPKIIELNKKGKNK